MALAGTASAATPEQATRARTCQIAESVIAGSLENEPVLARFDDEITYASRGNGTIQVIDFSDYSCPSCKAMAPWLVNLAGANSDIRVDHVEYPIYGRTMLSRVTGNKTLHGTRIALAILEAQPETYLVFHEALMATRGGVSNRKIRRAAEAASADLDAAITLSKQDTIRDRAETNMAYAKELGINGTLGIVADGIILSLGRWNRDDITCLIGEAQKARAAG